MRRIFRIRSGGGGPLAGLNWQPCMGSAFATPISVQGIDSASGASESFGTQVAGELKIGGGSR